MQRVEGVNEDENTGKFSGNYHLTLNLPLAPTLSLMLISTVEPRYKEGG